MSGTARAVTTPPPVGGWDTLNTLADMPAENAVVLDNWFPGTDRVTMRRGSMPYATGLGGAVESLMAYVPSVGVARMFAAAGSNIFDVTATGAVGAAVVTGMGNARWQSVQTTNAGGSYLLAVNGVNAPRIYNGTTWAAVTFTGPTVANVAWINLHHRRLWFGEANSLRAWYLDPNAIAGIAVPFDLGGFASLGGSIMAMGTWSRDSGGGTYDAAVFLTTEGEAIVYQGPDPSSAATWSLVGVFRIGKPIGRRCFTKAASDLILVTEDGFVATSTILTIDRSQVDNAALSRQINRAVNDAVRAYGGNFGWQPFIYPRGTALLFNVPTSTSTAQQFVFNTLTTKPCRFTGLNARCWALFNDRPYFGTIDGRVMQWDVGTSDNGIAIPAVAVQAFSYFGMPNRVKAFKSAKVIIESQGAPNAAIDICKDFQIKPPMVPVQANMVAGGRWGQARWGQSRWAGSDLYQPWVGLSGIGRSGALRVRVDGLNSTPSWMASTVLMQPGGVM